VRRLADLDAVTLDANGTLVELVDPVPKLERILRDRGVERSAAVVRRAFETEGSVYAGRAAEAHEPAAFARMQLECTSVFLAEVGAAALDPEEFAPAYVEAMEFEVLPGVARTLRFLRRCGLGLALVANFDLTLRDRLGGLGLAPSPDRALHIGDGRVDEDGARAAGMLFEWTPVPDAIARWRD
jgi:FMN phosphatase YigB (HAD superfamily)